MIDADQSVRYIHSDHLGTPRLLTNASQKAVWAWQGEPFGADQANEDPESTGTKYSFNLRFPGQYYDVETGNHYNLNRDYDPKVGRYVQSDPIGLAGGINTYAYVRGNPVSRIDPKGLFDEVHHLEITKSVLNDAGWPWDKRNEMAQLVADVDILPGSQKPDYEHSPWHAMCAPGQSSEDSDARREALTSNALQSCKLSDLAMAMHAAQDSAAGGHKQCQVWNGRVSLAHLKADIFPTKDAVNEALSKSAAILTQFEQKCGCGK
ncbi:RHS repeat domain-containing protein [Chitinimonas naiadis]